MEESKVPCLMRGCRLGQEQVLLMPEGIIKLSASALRILQLCDGSRDIAAIISALQAEFAPGAQDRIRGDVLSCLATLLEKKALELR